MKICFIDPPSVAYDDGRLFDISNPSLNRDNGLLPYYNLKLDLENDGFLVTTFDRHSFFSPLDLQDALYISFGRLRDIDQLKSLKIRLFAFFLLEPPLIDNKMYERLPILTKYFQNVFVHNLTGDCYSLDGVDINKLKKLYWPQPQSEVSETHWANKNRMNKIVIVNGHHRPKYFQGKELYSERIIWAIEINKYIPVDLFGRGWGKLFTRSSLWWVYLKSFNKIKEIYKGPCSSKIEIMSNYKFALCFENLRMRGYITEKIFDCFYAGTIPLYWGGDDIQTWIPAESFIDVSQFKSQNDLVNFLMNLSNEEIENYRMEAKRFFSRDSSRKYFKIYLNLKDFI